MEQEPICALFQFLLLSGQRSGEVKSMRWSDISNGIWILSSDQTKNRQRHQVPLSSQAKRVLNRLERAPKAESDFVFPSPRGGHLQWLQKAGNRICRRAGLDFTPHDLRRTAASKMAELGVDRFTLAKVLNHKSAEREVTAVYDKYRRDKEVRQALVDWGRELERIVSEGGSEKILTIAI